MFNKYQLDLLLSLRKEKNRLPDVLIRLKGFNMPQKKQRKPQKWWNIKEDW